MALMFMDGFDCYDSLADLQRGGVWNQGGTAAFTFGTFSTTGGRFGGGTFTLTATANPATFLTSIVFANNTTYYISFAMKQDILASVTGRTLFAVTDSANAQVFAISEVVTGKLSILNQAGTTIGTTASAVLPVATWVRIEIKFNTGTSTSTGSIELKVNGVVVIASLTAQNLFRALGGSLMYFQNANALGQTRSFDDVVVNDSAGSQNNTYLGDVRIDTLIPSADTAQADWPKLTGSSGYQMIDDPNGASDGDTTYIYSSTAGNKSEFDVTDLSGASTTINALQIRMMTERTNVGTATYRGYLKSVSSVANGATLTPYAGAYVWSIGDMVALDPNGSIAWTDAAVNAVKLGLERVA